MEGEDRVERARTLVAGAEKAAKRALGDGDSA